ncbi:hypothetical protein [Veillonella sp.]|uniref:hypothetical protein n=1 Tax=Veillonella sp. TaxID=1926307 RepID=UPI00257E4C81|nr:hypothetical protein [Veillonella sp.]MBS6486404.1 hypothetical protein [Veillonella sp.]
MKANKKTLMAVKQFLQEQEGWDLDEIKSDIVAETEMLKTKEMGELATDECGIEWDGKEVCVLEEFIDKYTDILIDKICNVLDSFVGEDISCYFDEE